jgi:gliding motility-associated-like protein
MNITCPYKHQYYTYFLLLTFILLGISPTIAQIPFVCQNNFYFSFSSGFNNPSQLHEVIIGNDGNVTFVPLPRSTGVNLNAIGYRSTDNFIYGIGVQDHRLFKIDATGQAFPLVILNVNHNNGFYAAEIAPDGSEMVILEQDQSSNRGTIALLKIDLTNDQYPIKARIPLIGPEIQCTDIAFDPISGILFGFDARGQRLITFDHNSGNIRTPYPQSAVADEMGGLYFDAFGNLFGYGNATNDPQARTFFGINKETGIVEVLATGPTARSKDGCACPFTIDLLKQVNPTQTVPCTEVTYTFEISNLSGSIREGIHLTDTMPQDLVILRVEDNPFGGTVSGIGGPILNIRDMTIPLGQGAITVIVEAQAFSQGVYKNQAHLDNLPAALGRRIPSDNPRTILNDDSTVLEVFPLLVDLDNQKANLCEGTRLEIVAGFLDGIDYQWNTGNTEASQIVTSPGLYTVTATNGCQTVFDSVFISEEEISVQLETEISIDLGETITLHPTTNAIGNIEFKWQQEGNPLDCSNCPTIDIRPFFDTHYEVEIISPTGCSATAQTFITVNKDKGIYIPNVFSPNQDGRNDVFYVMGKGFPDILNFEILDRWGNRVFYQNQGSINNPQYGWDGTFEGKMMNDGVFFYIVQLAYLDGIEETYFGDVTLMR